MTSPTLAFRAMVFALDAHRLQTRKYLGNPYSDHLAEVAAIVATVMPAELLQIALAVSWLHDTREDQNVAHATLVREFGEVVAEGVNFLTDQEEGNRTQRKALARQRLASAPHWVQTIKVADCLSNTRSIFEHDPKFAVVYREEVLALEAVLTKANPHLKSRLRAQLQASESTVCT